MEKETDVNANNAPKHNAFDMDSTKLRIRVAELCGWRNCRNSPQFLKDWWNGQPVGTPKDLNDPTNPFRELPDYCNDLNACHEFEMAMTDEQRVRFRLRLMFNSDGPQATFPTVEAALCHATAEQRCRSFVATMEASSVPKA